MPVPASVQTRLDDQNVPYRVATTPVDDNNHRMWHDQHLRNVGAARSVLLQDENGKVQIIIGANRLLDLQAVNQLLNRQLLATNASELASFCRNHKIQTIPALPKIAGMLTLVDENLLEQEALLLDSGSEEQLLQLSREEFRQVLEDARVCAISVALAPLENDPSHLPDSDLIIRAVENFTQLRIKQRLEETLELPPLSETAQRIIKLRVNPNADVSDLAQIVETDPSLAAQVVSWAASPYYSAPGKIRSIHDAIVRVLGFDMVLNLALGLALGRSLQIPRQSPHSALPYWQQAVYVAATIEGLVTAIPRDQRPTFGIAYLCGLLHNFGYLILAEVFPPHFSHYCNLADANSHITHQAIERHLLGVTRDQISSTLMSLWSMPDEVVVALRHQNNPHYQGEHHRYAKLVFVAQRLLLQQGIGHGPKLDIPQHVFDELHLDPQKAVAAVKNILESESDLEFIALQLSPH